MKIWGYIFIVLNFAAAGAFIYFATQVWKAHTEWQYALLKQELANRGLPLEAPAQPAADADDDTVSFDYSYLDLKYGSASYHQIAKATLTTLIPQGGPVFGVKPGEVVSNQVDEVKRVEKIVFDDLGKISSLSEKRLRLMIFLLNLSKGTGREGTYALLRDFLDEKRRPTARREIAFLGKSGPQVSALLAFSAVAETHLAYGPNVDPAVKDTRVRAGRRALIGWAISEIPNVTPDPLPPTIPPEPTDNPMPPSNPEKERLTAVLAAIEPAMEADMPDLPTIEAGKQRLLGLLEGDDALQSERAKALIPFIAEIGTNALDSEAKVAEAKAKLLKLLLHRATTDGEQKSLTAIAELMVPSKQDDKQKELEQLEANVDTAATELLRSYFEDALAKPPAELPVNDEEARSKLMALKPIRDPGEQRRAIAHLLYHLDAHVGISPEARAIWYKAFIPPEVMKASDGAPIEPDAGFKMRTLDEDLLTNRAAWHQRVVAVVGLEGYVPVVEAQATELNRIYQRLQVRLIEEQSHFESEYQAVVLQALYLAGQLETRETEVKGQEKLKGEHDVQLAIRVAEKAALENELAAVTATANTALKELEGKVDELFQITKQLGEAQDALVSLEMKLRDLELGPKAKK